MTKLSSTKKGACCKFVSTSCDADLGHRLLEMGFMPGENIVVVTNTGSKGSIMVKVKGSKIALSNKIADQIIVLEEDNGKNGKK
ncbi:MAG: ferrous iron transport protein A [Endomicrobia bacterium]|nr:ferrous iron transport protein A [Endomicrobiia bacterium]